VACMKGISPVAPMCPVIAFRRGLQKRKRRGCGVGSGGRDSGFAPSRRRPASGRGEWKIRSPQPHFAFLGYCFGSFSFAGAAGGEITVPPRLYFHRRAIAAKRMRISIARSSVEQFIANMVSSPSALRFPQPYPGHDHGSTSNLAKNVRRARTSPDFHRNQLFEKIRTPTDFCERAAAVERDG
jgi:hypothetical protein